MPKHRGAVNCNFLPWLTALKTNNGEGRFIQVGNSFFFHDAVKSLSSGAFQRFDFPAATIKKYGLTLRSCREHIEELYEKGFIDIDGAGATRMPNHYEFSNDWKNGKTRAPRAKRKKLGNEPK